VAHINPLGRSASTTRWLTRARQNADVVSGRQSVQRVYAAEESGSMADAIRSIRSVRVLAHRLRVGFVPFNRN